MGDGGQGQVRRRWSERLPETLLEALAGMDVSIAGRAKHRVPNPLQ